MVVVVGSGKWESGIIFCNTDTDTDTCTALLNIFFVSIMVREKLHVGIETTYVKDVSSLLDLVNSFFRPFWSATFFLTRAATR